MRVSPHRNCPVAERTLTRRCAPTSPASGRGDRVRRAAVLPLISRVRKSRTLPSICSSGFPPLTGQHGAIRQRSRHATQMSRREPRAIRAPRGGHHERCRHRHRLRARRCAVRAGRDLAAARGDAGVALCLAPRHPALARRLLRDLRSVPHRLYRAGPEPQRTFEHDDAGVLRLRRHRRLRRRDLCRPVRRHLLPRLPRRPLRPRARSSPMRCSATPRPP
ncbi:hypothetical protein ACVIHC_005846 [Bradyrhizobium diazoefficiens]